MDVNISKADYIDQFLRANGATSMAIIIHNSMALTKLLNSSIIMFIPSDFALDKIIAKSGQTLNEIRPVSYTHLVETTPFASPTSARRLFALP